jgi:phage/plasmid-like protein (TIGR03299 family)
MTVEHTFLKNLDSNEARADAIAKLPEWRKKGIIKRAVPGVGVGGLTWSEAMTRAGADFEVYEAPLFAHSKSGMVSEAPKHKGIVRYDNNDVVGVVGSTFGTVQHHEALAGLQGVCERGNASLEALSVEDGGARISATALLGFTSITQLGDDGSNGDALAHFMRAKNAHDGSGCMELVLSTLRMVCLNGMTTMARAHSIKLRHSSKVINRVTAANIAVDRLIVAAMEEAETFQRMAQDRITLKTFIEFAGELLTDVRGEADTKRKKDRRVKDVSELTAYFRTGKGNHGLSAYDAYNSITDWLAVRRDTYADSAKFATAFRNNETGTAARTRTRALALLTQ